MGDRGVIFGQRAVLVKKDLQEETCRNFSVLAGRSFDVGDSVLTYLMPGPKGDLALLWRTLDGVSIRPHALDEYPAGQVPSKTSTRIFGAYTHAVSDRRVCLLFRPPDRGGDLEDRREEKGGRGQFGMVPALSDGAHLLSHRPSHRAHGLQRRPDSSRPRTRDDALWGISEDSPREDPGKVREGGLHAQWPPLHGKCRDRQPDWPGPGDRGDQKHPRHPPKAPGSLTGILESLLFFLARK